MRQGRAEGVASPNAHATAVRTPTVRPLSVNFRDLKEMLRVAFSESILGKPCWLANSSPNSADMTRTSSTEVSSRDER